MALPHRQWLAAQVLSDQQTVSYRMLARALKVHVNSAKRMLYDFHAHENAKRPGSVHATYLLAGSKKVNEKTLLENKPNGVHHDVEPVPSSPPAFTSSMLQSSQRNGEGEDTEAPSIRTITLVRGKSLDAVKSSYETITSIHVYSLSPHHLQDLQTLSDTSRHVYDTYFVKEDPLEHNATYGVIINKNVKRRIGRRLPPQVADSKSAVDTEKAARSTTSKPVGNPFAARQPPTKREETSRPSSAGSTTTTSTTSTKQPTLKRDTSDIFKSFAKAKKITTKTPPTLSRNGTDSSVGNTSADEVPTKLPDPSEDEGESEDEALFLDTKTRVPAKKRPSTGKSDRAAKLRKMMDDSDEEMEDTELIDPEEAGLGTGDQPQQDGKSQDTALEQATAPQQHHQTDDDNDNDNDAEAEDVNWSDSDTERPDPLKKAAAVEEDTSTAAQVDPAPPKRRRGKRKVMKKKTLKDDEGYLVTREEAVWESFSEEEPAPAASAPAYASGKANGKGKLALSNKAQAQSQSQSQSQGKAGGGGTGTGGKGGKAMGGGGIMSFFGKQ